jgi:hypothetical protein
MTKSHIILKVLLGLTALSNIFIGLLGVIPAIPVSKVATLFYSAVLTVSPQLEHITQMFGAYMLTLGILAALAIFDPIKNKFIIYGVIFMLFLRTLQRVLFANQASIVFNIPVVAYWVQTVVYFAVALLLLLFILKVTKASKA